MRAGVKYGLLGALALSAGVVSALPARAFDAALSTATDGRWRLAGVEGTVWDGAGTLELAGAPQQGSRVGWRFAPRELLSGRLAWGIASEGSQGRIALSPWRGEVSALSLRLPLPPLPGALGPLGLSGALRLDLPSLSWQGGQWQGSARAELKGLSSPRVMAGPLGDYRLDVNAAGQAASLTLATLSGPLTLSGSGDWQPARGLALAGSAGVAAGAGDEVGVALKPLLALIGAPGGDGSVEWRLGDAGR
ncbi:hypothetical protein EBB06_10655 [Crenobacter cavernae]|uniref:Type II secretion system protein N n=1 Tax=Crenobacter cavernae TaxID=2290923 RepID=A0ABY0FB76_9NEIS|nr:hypothetical protein EBB06_10655 [Crenobacter cavernae]